MLFFTVAALGTLASGAGWPTINNIMGRSLAGRPKILLKNFIGLGVCQRGQTNIVQRVDKKPCSNAHRLRDVVVLLFFTRMIKTIPLRKDRYKPRRSL